MKMNEHKPIEQKNLNPPNGIAMLILFILLSIFSVLGFIAGLVFGSFILVAVCVLLWIVLPFCFGGLRSVRPNEALVLTLFGKYYGTINKPGYFFVNPFSRYNNPAYDAQMASGTQESSEDLKTALFGGKSGPRTTRNRASFPFSTLASTARVSSRVLHPSYRMASKSP
jgi:hypothetical protein